MKWIAEIKQICTQDVYETDFASFSGLLPAGLSKYKYGISIARKLDDSIIDDISNGPTLAYHDLYHRINNELNRKTEEIHKLLLSHDIESYPVKATVDEDKRDDNYTATLRYFFSHKMAATRAGLGWIGKTDLLVTKRFGPRVRLATVLMTSQIADIGKPINESLCGDCDRCVEKCPAQAATGQLWRVDIDRNVFFNPFKCRDFCRKTAAEKINKEISICGICVSVCPEGKK